ncbi:hypothetical protein MLD38_001200 [Melastoma candidum]|uniref:Uncharacterized protein n=1 Tax=Melastoma candidum TaxID=119954 RepID=A0ACB9SL32_9MYRT|nr:hypothetical protein MLD38_001200 [Melastoma candidum]
MSSLGITSLVRGKGKKKKDILIYIEQVKPRVFPPSVLVVDPAAIGDDRIGKILSDIERCPQPQAEEVIVDCTLDVNEAVRRVTYSVVAARAGLATIVSSIPLSTRFPPSRVREGVAGWTSRFGQMLVSEHREGAKPDYSLTTKRALFSRI